MGVALETGNEPALGPAPRVGTLGREEMMMNYRMIRDKLLARHEVGVDVGVLVTNHDQRVYEHGTVNVLAVDSFGDVAGITSTSGLSWKIPGRIRE